MTSRGELALQAMIELARIEAEASGQRDVRAVELAERCRVTKQTMEQSLSALKIAGLIQSRRGRAGGYRLAHDPTLTTVADVLTVIEGPVALAPCGTPEEPLACHWCAGAPECSLRTLWLDVSEAISSVLHSKSISALACEPSARTMPGRLTADAPA